MIPGSESSLGEQVGYPLQYSWASLVTQMAKNLPAMQETRVRSLGQEDPLGKGMATHSSIVACRVPWTQEPGRRQPMGVTKRWTRLSYQHFHFSLSGI